MTFAELIAEVIVKTNRVDMGLVSSGGSGEIPAAIRKSTMTLHNKEVFFRDLQSAQIKFDTSSYIQTLDTSALPRYKQIKHIRKWDPTLLPFQLDPTLLPPLFYTGIDYSNTNSTLAFLKIIDVSSALDDYGYDKADVAYQAGDTIFIRSSTSLLWALASWTVFPKIGDINGVGYESWIARDYPYAIVAHASSAIFSDIGQQDISRKMDGPTGEVTEQIQILIQNNLLASVR